MSVLLLGGRGKTSIRIAKLLHDAKVSCSLASRSTSEDCPYPQAVFDWFDDKTWMPLLEGRDSPFKAVYLIAPPITNPVPLVQSFIETAYQSGIKRFVLLSASTVESGGPMYGQVHRYLTDSGLEYAVLRPTWFMQNFSEQPFICKEIKGDGKIFSATKNGKVPWVSADDIAAVAFRCLTDELPHNTDHVILGPELLSYDEVAQILSDVLGRAVSHVNLSVPDLVRRFESAGMPTDYAQILAGLDATIAEGAENRLNTEVKDVTGRPPTTFREYAEKARGAWV